MPHKGKLLKALAAIALITAAVLFLPGKALAQNPWFNASWQEHQAALEECKTGEVGLECTVQAIVNTIWNSLNEGAAPSPATLVAAPDRPGAMQFAGTLITTLIANPPVSTVEYLGYLARKLNPVSPAYAQGGTGFRALSALIPIWSAFRNIAYLAFVVIFILIGFMIMFRARLDPQTVVNVQNSLPKLVITLLLITFSYAIAAFMVDLIYLGIYLVVAVLASQGLILNPTTVRQDILNESVFTMIFQAGFMNWADNIAQAVTTVIGAALNETFLRSIYGILPLKNEIVTLIIAVAVLFSMFRLFFQLLIAYVSIIIQTILSPLLLLFNALPGSGSFGNWVRNFLANVLIFPAVAMIFLISAILIGQPGGRWQVRPSIAPGTAWTPPFVAMEADVRHVMSIVGLGFLLFAPQMVAVIQKSLKAQPLPVAGVFAPIAAGAAVAAAPFRGTGGAIGTGARVYFGEKIERLARRGETAGPGR